MSVLLPVPVISICSIPISWFSFNVVRFNDSSLPSSCSVSLPVPPSMLSVAPSTTVKRSALPSPTSCLCSIELSCCTTMSSSASSFNSVVVAMNSSLFTVPDSKTVSLPSPEYTFIAVAPIAWSVNSPVRPLLIGMPLTETRTWPKTPVASIEIVSSADPPSLPPIAKMSPCTS